jgi:SAM-dependent methyltransferase
MDTIQQLRVARDKIGSWGHLNKARLKAVLEFAGEQILDAGCSTGAYVNYLCARGYNAYGLDLLRANEWEGGESAYRFMIGDLCGTPYRDNSFDSVLAFEILEHIKHIDSALGELHRITKRNIVLSVPNCETPLVLRKSGLTFHHWVDRTHYQAFTEDTLRSVLVRNAFRVDMIKRINPIKPEVLFLESWRLPIKLAVLIGRAANKLPLKKKYYMTILAVASKGAK